MTAALGTLSPANLARYLGGCRFPCQKQELLDLARRNLAESEVIEALNDMPEQTYRSMADVMRGVGDVE